MHNQLLARPPTRPYVVLATCCLSLLLVTMDVTIVNVALPAIRHDFHASVAGLQWSIDGYTVVVACFLMLAGAMGDRHGRRRTFQVGLSLFSLGSLLCSLAPSTPALVAFRMVQALGGAMLNPVAMSIIANTFTEPKERARAIGIWGAVFGVSMAMGPLVGGVLTQTVGWRSIFWINVPIGLSKTTSADSDSVISARSLASTARRKRFMPRGESDVVDVIGVDFRPGLRIGRAPPEVRPSGGWRRGAVVACAPMIVCLQ